MRRRLVLAADVIGFLLTALLFGEGTRRLLRFVAYLAMWAAWAWLMWTAIIQPLHDQPGLRL
jgi:hypothetical protein